MTPKNYSKTHPKREPVRDLCGAIKPNRLECTLPAGWGTDHPGIGPCKHHFGNTARVVRSAGLQQGKAIAKVLKGMGVTADVDPGDALRWEVNNTLGHIAWFRAVINTWELLEPDGSAKPMTPDQVEFYERYQSERAHLVRAARMAVAADVEGRAMKLAEEQAELVGGALDRIFAALRLTPAQRDALADVVPAEMRAITALPKPLELEGVFSTDDALNEAYVEAKKK